MDDPTVRRCLGFARAWGFGSLEVVNLFALRSTNPKALRVADDPNGPENDRHISAASYRAGLIVAAWGAHGSYRERDAQVMALLHGLPVYCLGCTLQGDPRHPLYVRGDVERVLYGGRATPRPACEVDDDGRDRHPRTATCARCGGPSCDPHDRCHGCERLICPACDSAPTPAFSFPGDAYVHPHNGPEAA